MKDHIEYLWNFYNDIPNALFHNSPRILDVGCGFGKNQLLSRHSTRFLEANSKGRYLGFEKQFTSFPLLQIEERDYLEYPTIPNFYDLVLAIHFIEHIDILKWKRLFELLKSNVNENGYLFIITPYKERPKKGFHEVFDIDETLIREYLPDAEIYLSNIVMSSLPNGNPILKIINYIRCFLKGERRIPFGLDKKSIIAIWRKKNED